MTPNITNMAFQHVSLSWIIQSNQELNFDFQYHCHSWILNGPWYNTMICSQFHCSSFEYYVTTGKRDRYNIMCSIEDHDIDFPTVNDDAISGGGRPLTPDS